MIKNENICDCEMIHDDIVHHVQDEIISDDSISDMSKLYKVFGDKTRLHILAALRCHEMCVCDLAVLMNMTKSATSHQLKVLRDNNLVHFRKIGKHSYYSLADDHIKYILDIALDHVNE